MDPDADAVSYDEFLALARDEGLIALDVQVVQAPADANGRSAVVQATARTAQGSFGAVGEASPHSAPPAWQPFLTTLAELRAKARALRDLTGLEHGVLEELSTPYQKTESDAPAWRQPPANGAAPRPSTVTPSRAAAAVPTPTVAPVRPTVRPAPPAFDEDDTDDAAPDEETTAPQDVASAESAPPSTPTAAEPARPAAPIVSELAHSSASATSDLDEEPDSGFDAMGRDMEAKLVKMALSIASLEGSDISETEARQKLDDFFLRAFKHPLSRASRMEGQRVVQRLSGDLARLRTAANEEKE